jgi:hypothetical protein
MNRDHIITKATLINKIKCAVKNAVRIRIRDALAISRMNTANHFFFTLTDCESVYRTGIVTEHMLSVLQDVWGVFSAWLSRIVYALSISLDVWGLSVRHVECQRMIDFRHFMGIDTLRVLYPDLNFLRSRHLIKYLKGISP